LRSLKAKILFTLALSFSISMYAQNYSVGNERMFENLFISSVDTAANFHTSIQPFSQNEINKVFNYDSIIDSYAIKTQSGFVNRIVNQNLLEVKGDKFGFILNPIINAGATIEKSSSIDQTILEKSFGLSVKTSVGKKWSAQLALLSDNTDYPTHIQNNVSLNNVSPGYGYSIDNHSLFAEGNITFTPDDVFTIQAGYGKHFIGDGYRSLFLSDHANSYPYLKVAGKIWKLKYMSLNTSFQEVRGSGGKLSNYFHKFSSIHYLSANVTKWWNFGFFESIVWQAQEGDFYRGFDINYMNPVIFMRPVEYAQGSSDNALMGLSTKIRLKKKNILYGQILIDEFLLDELRAGDGWWANKYGIQFGFKAQDFMWVKNLRLRIEYNVVRPFTYSYSYTSTAISTLQNYAHFNSPLAHPLGANFKEVLASLNYSKKRWQLEVMSTFAQVGLDTNALGSIGQDVYRPYGNRDDDYGFVVGGGNNTTIINNTLKCSYVVNPKSQMILQFGVTNRSVKNTSFDSSQNMFFFGLKTAITNRYFGY